MGKVATITVDDRVGQQHYGEYDYKSICYTVHELKSTKTMFFLIFKSNSPANS